jgi:dTDP-4-dehydrorhamnose reductase
MLHISTDFVFDGRTSTPYVETDPVAPISVYGRSKAAGEAAVRENLDRHLIIRTAWLYGTHGQNFVKSMLRLGHKNPELRVVADQVGCPTFAGDLAAGLLTLVQQIQDNRPIDWGTYHLCGTGAVSWYGFACRIMEIAHRLELAPAVSVTPISTAEYPTPAARPAFSVLSCRKIRTRFGITPPAWETSLEKMLKQLAEPAEEPAR